MTCTRIGKWIVCHGRKYDPGEMPPKGYNDWFEWAKVQRKAGLRSVACGMCGKCKWPQELSDETVDYKFRKTEHGPEFVVKKPICKKCVQSQG